MYYELGVVHSFRLPVVVLVDRADSLSFDTQHERVIEIGDAGTITARQADAAKKKLRETLAVVLKADYVPTSLVTEVAQAQSLAKLAPDDPVASEIATINQKLDEVMAVLRATGGGGGLSYRMPLVSSPAMSGAAPTGGVTLTSSVTPINTLLGLQEVIKSDRDRYSYLADFVNKSVEQNRDALIAGDALYRAQPEARKAAAKPPPRVTKKPEAK